MLKKITAGCAVVVAAFLYIVFGNRQSASVMAAPPATPTGASQPASSPDASSSAAGGSGASGSGVTDLGVSAGGASALKDGTYTGPVADAIYGNLQVAAVVSGGKLTAVNILEEPDAPGHTSDVSATAIPQLVREAIAAQSAQVDIVSGATQDSEAFQQSLGSALEAAQA